MDDLTRFEKRGKLYAACMEYKQLITLTMHTNVLSTACSLYGSVCVSVLEWKKVVQSLNDEDLEENIIHFSYTLATLLESESPSNTGFMYVSIPFVRLFAS
jgi:hypothetical protein